MPVRPWAIVSWISRAMRARSSRTPGLPRLRDELALEPDVLVHGDLELGHRLAALLAQLGQPLAEDRPEADRDVWMMMIAPYRNHRSGSATGTR